MLDATRLFVAGAGWVGGTRELRGDRLLRGPFLLRFRGEAAGADQAVSSRLRWMPTSPRALPAHRVGDCGASVPALGDVRGAAEPAHQLCPGPSDPPGVPVELGRLTGEAVPRHAAGPFSRGRDPGTQ
jgi:hypothetical protein